MNSNPTIELDYGNCEIARFCGKEVYVKDVSLRTGTWYKADNMVKLAPHSEGLSSMSEVNHEVVHRNNVFLPGEVSVRGLNGFQSTHTVQASVAAMLQASQTEKSAKGIVVVSESVSSCVPLVRGEVPRSADKTGREANRTMRQVDTVEGPNRRRGNNRRCSMNNHATHFEENRFPQQSPEQPISGKTRSSLAERTLGALQIRRTGESLIFGHCFFGTAVIRTRMSGGVGAGGVNAPRYPILPS